MLAVHLVKPYCLRSLLYSGEIWRLNNTDARSIDVPWNNAFRQIFNGYWIESVNLLQFYYKCLPATVQIDVCKILFWRKMFYRSNVVLHILAAECRQFIAAIANRYSHVTHRRTDGRTDNADSYSWPPHCGELANQCLRAAKKHSVNVMCQYYSSWFKY